MSILVSIIVPCYNHARFLDEALHSVLEQTYTHWECIIVNDGSPDNTKLVAEKWCAKDKRFTYLEKQNGGLSSARNAGIKISKGEFILPLDADDIIHETCLEKLVPVLESNNALAIVAPYSKFFYKSINDVVFEHKPLGSTYLDLMFVNQLVATSLYRKSCWEALGGYDETMKKGFEDWEFWLAITKLGWEYKVVEDFLFYYRKSKKSMLTDTISEHSEAVTEYIFRKHKDLYVKHFDNTAEVLFYYIKTHRLGKMKIKSSIEYKIGKLLLKPYRLLSRLFIKANNT